MQSLSWPDSALLGNHQFQSMALTGNVVSLLLCTSSKVSDNCVAINQLEVSCDVSFVSSSDVLDDEITEKGTTESLSRPDSALLGIHQFQATALTGSMVNLLSL